MNYTAIIVDDEPWSLIDIQKCFPFAEFGFSVLGAYQNPELALEKIFETDPDLIITDIRMPNLTGLALMEQVREHGLQSEIVIISGHSDFAYAKQALSLGAAAYCLKPTNVKEVRETMSRVRRRLDERTGRANPATATHKNGFEGLLEYIDVHFYERLVLGELAQRFSINANYCCTLFAKHTGGTFSQYVAALRIAKARALIDTTPQPLEKIASMVGFPDYFYFSKVFKRICGLSPRAYKKQGSASR